MVLPAQSPSASSYAAIQQMLPATAESKEVAELALCLPELSESAYAQKTSQRLFARSHAQTALSLLSMTQHPIFTRNDEGRALSQTLARYLETQIIQLEHLSASPTSPPLNHDYRAGPFPTG